MSYSVKTLQDIIKHFFQIISTILLCTIFQCTLMPVDGCNLAQLTAWAYGAMRFNCAAQALHFLKHEKTYSVATPKPFWHLL